MPTPSSATFEKTPFSEPVSHIVMAGAGGERLCFPQRGGGGLLGRPRPSCCSMARGSRGCPPHSKAAFVSIWRAQINSQPPPPPPCPQKSGTEPAIR